MYSISVNRTHSIPAMTSTPLMTSELPLTVQLTTNFEAKFDVVKVRSNDATGMSIGFYRSICDQKTSLVNINKVYLTRGGFARHL